MSDRDTFDGEVALVTGSTAGIGREVARELAQRGADVVVNGRTEETGTEVVEELRDLGATARFERADITEYEHVESMVENTIDEMGGIDVLVGSGATQGTEPPGFFRDLDPEAHTEFCQHNYIARLYPIKAALDHMIESDGGRIVNVSADAGLWPTPGDIGAGGPTAALMMATRTLAAEFARWDIRVNTVSISVTEDTPGLEWVMENSPAANVFEKAIEKQSFPVYGEDVAEAVAFLAGERPITGQILSVNGGVSFP